MSIDFTKDYSNHTLLDNKRKYKEVYRLEPSEFTDVKKGDLLLLKTMCGCYGVFMATADSDEDGTLHVTRYAEIEFEKMGEEDPTGSIIVSTNNPCIC